MQVIATEYVHMLIMIMKFIIHVTQFSLFINKFLNYFSALCSYHSPCFPGSCSDFIHCQCNSGFTGSYGLNRCKTSMFVNTSICAFKKTIPSYVYEFNAFLSINMIHNKKIFNYTHN